MLLLLNMQKNILNAINILLFKCTVTLMLSLYIMIKYDKDVHMYIFVYILTYN